MQGDREAFAARDAEILAIGPDGPNAYRRYWDSEKLALIGLPDPKHTVANLYHQEVNLFKLGRMPALLVIDKQGFIRYEHYGDSMKDIPENSILLDLLDSLNEGKIS